MFFPIKPLEATKDSPNAIKNRVILVVFLLAGGLLAGCAGTPLINCAPKQIEIEADGQMEEWPNDPLFVDDDTQMSLYALSDQQALSIGVTFGRSDKKEKRPPRMGGVGLTVWIDPGGGKEKIFGVHVSGGGSPRGPGGPMPGGKETAPPANAANKDSSHDNKPPRMPQGEDNLKVSITYADTTGPLTMTLDEVRRTGIDIGVGQSKDGAEVYEFDIAFRAGPSLENLSSGMLIGVGITRSGGDLKMRNSHGSNDRKSQDNPPEGGGGGGGREPGGGSMGGPPGGRMGGGMMGGGPGSGGSGGGGPGGNGLSGKKQDRTCSWFKVQLADTVKK